MKSAAATLAAAMLIAIAIAAIATETAAANGAATIIMDRTQGPYRLIVGIIPARPVVPTTHLTIQIFPAGAASDGAAPDDDDSPRRPLRDTEVALQLTATGPPGAPDFGPTTVYNEQTLRYFEIDVPFAAVGQWQLSLSVSSERGAQVFALPLQVGEPRASVQWVWIAGMLALIIVVGIWTFLTLQRRRNDSASGSN